MIAWLYLAIDSRFSNLMSASSLSIRFLSKALGGAVAVWASSGLTEPDKQLVMNKELMRQWFNGQWLTVGEAVLRAKRAVSDLDVRKTWILFGDPATKLK